MRTVASFCLSQDVFAQSAESQGPSYWYVLHEDLTLGLLVNSSIHCTRAEANLAVERVRDLVLNGRAVHAVPEKAFQKQKEAGLIYLGGKVPGKPTCE